MAGSSSKKRKSNVEIPGHTSDRKKELLEELSSLLPQIDENGLSFLIQQATTLIYNQNVNELNKSRDVAEKSAREAEATTTEKTHVFFEAGKNQKTFFLDVNGKRAILDQAELMHLVKIAQTASGSKVGQDRIFHWFETYRDDILFDCGIQTKGPKLSAIYDHLIADFAIRE